MSVVLHAEFGRPSIAIEKPPSETNGAQYRGSLESPMKPAASGQLTPMKLERAPSYSAKFFGNGILKGGENNTPQNGRAVKKLHSSRSLGRSSEDMATLERVAEWAEADSFTGPGEKELHARVLAWQEIMRRQQVLASPPG